MEGDDVAAVVKFVRVSLLRVEQRHSSTSLLVKEEKKREEKEEKLSKFSAFSPARKLNLTLVNVLASWNIELVYVNVKDRKRGGKSFREKLAKKLTSFKNSPKEKYFY